jgi:hypothetical protein
MMTHSQPAMTSEKNNFDGTNPPVDRTDPETTTDGRKLPDSPEIDGSKSCTITPVDLTCEARSVHF